MYHEFGAGARSSYIPCGLVSFNSLVALRLCSSRSSQRQLEWYPATVGSAYTCDAYVELQTLRRRQYHAVSSFWTVSLLTVILVRLSLAGLRRSSSSHDVGSISAGQNTARPMPGARKRRDGYTCRDPSYIWDQTRLHETNALLHF